jgi:TIR domain
MRVFLSYSRRDQRIAGEVRRRLEADGHDVWQDVDPRAIPGGARWRASIEQGIRQSDVFVLLLSPNVVANPKHPREELEFADSAGKELRPVYLKPLKELPDGFGLVLGGVEHVCLFPSVEVGMVELLACLGDAGADGVEAIMEPERGQSASGRFNRLRRTAHQLRVQAQHQEVGKKLLKVGVGAVAVGAALVAAGAAGQTVERASTRREARSKYRDRVTKPIAAFSREFGREHEASTDEDSTDEIRVNRYQREFRPRLWNLVGQLEGVQPPDTDLEGPHQAFVSQVRGCLTNLDEAYSRYEAREYQDANRAYQRSIEELFGSLEAYVVMLERTL